MCIIFPSEYPKWDTNNDMDKYTNNDMDEYTRITSSYKYHVFVKYGTISAPQLIYCTRTMTNAQNVIAFETAENPAHEPEHFWFIEDTDSKNTIAWPPAD